MKTASALRVAPLALALCAVACEGDEGKAPPPASPDAGAEPETATAIDPGCVPPADCLPVVSPFVNIGVCCGEELRCGFDFSILEGNATPEEAAFFGIDLKKPCLPRSSLFFEQPPSPEERVKAGNGPDILVTPACTSRNLANTAFVGCCLPGGRCGLSTHLATTALQALSEGADEPFNQPECVTPKELNAQLLDSVLAAFGHFPPSSGACDYADLDARLPR